MAEKRLVADLGFAVARLTYNTPYPRLMLLAPSCENDHAYVPPQEIVIAGDGMKDLVKLLADGGFCSEAIALLEAPHE